MEKYFKALQGITYAEWIKLNMVIDKSFYLQKRELASKLQLADLEKLNKLTLSLFG